ncbi:LOW QUALITY PROTEIN: DNA-directed RNA polymerase III subunit RPC7-like [Menidia menidia]
MAARGRGRRMPGGFCGDPGGLGRGDPPPPSIQQPTPVFPVLEQKPLPLAGGEEVDYLLALKQDFRAAMRTLPGFIQPAAAHRDVERYSDKYHASEQTDDPTGWAPDLKRFPKELRVHVRRTPREGVPVAPPVRGQQPSRRQKEVGGEEVLLKLETLEKKEEQQNCEEEEKKQQQEEEEEEPAEEEYDEEEFEEETDYIMSYFDNGEEFGGDSDDNMDEAVY